MENAFEIRNLSKKYKDFSLDNVNIALPEGCIMGIVGENGAGKTTMIKSMMGLISIDSGEIDVLGQDSRNLKPQVKEHIGVVMDDCSFPENLNFKNINLIMKKSYKTWDEEKFLEFGRRFGLSPDKKVKEYSKGMKMKLSIAAAMSHDSRLLILDEPTSGLDPVVRDEILDIFLEFIQDEKHSIFFSSHIINDLEKICDYFTVIHKGKVLLSDEKDVLLDKYVILKCSEEELAKVEPSAVIGVRKNRFGAEALILREYAPENSVTERPGLEEIMLYHVKEMR
ncbi:MAG: ABC transporter ATP-binding protein [Bacillota bacterium]|nr:ABC transporter ATP-binding protein [Bacillota bacterium]